MNQNAEIGQRLTTVVFAQGLGALLSALAVLIITRSIGQNGYGTVKWAISFVALFSFIPNMGLYNAHIKRTSEGRDLGECVGTLIMMDIPLMILMIAALAIAIFLSGEARDPTIRTVLYIAVIYQLVFSLRSLVFSTFKAKRESAKEQVSFLIEPIIRIILVIIIALLFLGGNGKMLMIAYLLGILGSFSFAVYHLKAIHISFSIKRNRDLIKSYWGFAKHLIPLMIISVFAVNLDKVLIGSFFSMVEVGQYCTAQMINGLLIQITMAFGIILFPTISSIGSKRHDEVRSFTRFMGRYLSMITTPVVVYLIIFGRDLLGLFPGASPAYSALIFLSLYAFVYSLGVPYTYLLLGIDRPDINSRILITGHIITIILGFMLIPILGITGGGIALFLAYLVVFFLAAFAAKRTVGAGMELIGKNVLYHLLAGGLTALLTLPISFYFETGRWFYVVGLALLILGIYLGILYLLGEFDEDDFNFLKDSIHPVYVLKYIGKEIMGKNDGS